MFRTAVSLLAVNLLGLTIAMPAQAQITPEGAPAASTTLLEPSPVNHMVLPQPVSHLGGASQVFFGGSLGASVGGSSRPVEGLDNVQGKWLHDFQLLLNPSVGMFATDNFFVRLDVAFQMKYDVNKNVTSSVGLLPGFGFRVPMGRAHAWLPSLGYTLASIQPLNNDAVIGHGGFVDLPFMFEVAPHLGLTVGPRVSALTNQDGNKDVTVSYSVNFGLLGWL